jgi:hypothetical protein
MAFVCHYPCNDDLDNSGGEYMKRSVTNPSCGVEVRYRRKRQLEFIGLVIQVNPTESPIFQDVRADATSKGQTMSFEKSSYGVALRKPSV